MTTTITTKIDPTQMQSFIDSLGSDAASVAKDMDTGLFDTVKEAVEAERKKRVIELIQRIAKLTEGSVKKLRQIRKAEQKEVDQISKLKETASKLLAGDVETWEKIDETIRTYEEASRSDTFITRAALQ